MIKAISVKVLEDYRLWVGFANGENRIFDVKPHLVGTWFSDLMDKEIFKTVHIAGLSVEWAGGQDICPDELYENSISVNEEGKILKL